MRFLVVDQEHIHPEALRLLEQHGHRLAPILPADLQERAQLLDVEGILTTVSGLITKEVVGKAPKLACIISCSAGLDHIDLATCKQRSIAVYHAPASNASAVADHTIALLFAVLRKLAIADKHVRTGRFERDQFLGLELDHKVLGLVGFGAVGRLVAKKLSGFSIRVLAYDPLLSREQIGQHTDVRGMDIRKVELETVLRDADVISIHVPLLESTRNLVSKPQFARMKPTAILLNTSRGPVVNEADLIEALRTKKIFGAGLDVFDGEPNVNRSFFGLENVVLSPHIAAMTEEARRKMAVQAVESFLKA